MKIVNKYILQSTKDADLWMKKLIDALAANDTESAKTQADRLAREMRDYAGLPLPLINEPFNSVGLPRYADMLRAACIIDELEPKPRFLERGPGSGGGLRVHGDATAPNSYEIRFEFDKAKDNGRWLTSASNDLLIWLKDKFGGDIEETVQGSARIGSIKIKTRNDTPLDTVLKAFSERTRAQAIDGPSHR
jgi:hypothetical protein